MSFRRRVQAIPERSRCAQHALRQKGCVDERLTIAGEVQTIARCGIDGASDRALRQGRILRAQRSFRGVAVGRRWSHRHRIYCGQLDPWRDAGEQSPERLEVGHRPPIRARCLFDRHSRLERPAREIRQYGIGEAPHDRHPELPILPPRIRTRYLRAGWLLHAGWLPRTGFGRLRGGEQHARARPLQELPSIHEGEDKANRCGIVRAGSMGALTTADGGSIL